MAVQWMNASKTIYIRICLQLRTRVCITSAYEACSYGAGAGDEAPCDTCNIVPETIWRPGDSLNMFASSLGRRGS